MGSKGGKAKQQIAAYQMSIHLGFCYAVDAVLELFVKEKSIWKGAISDNTDLTIDQQNLFGGVKKEGGLWGAVAVLQGRASQVLPEYLATRLGRTTATAPGFRDILSLFFYGAPGQGFLWSHNYPYLHPIWLKVKRTLNGGAQWYPEKAEIVLIPGETTNATVRLLTRFDGASSDDISQFALGSGTVSFPSCVQLSDGNLRVGVTGGAGPSDLAGIGWGSTAIGSCGSVNPEMTWEFIVSATANASYLGYCTIAIIDCGQSPSIHDRQVRISLQGGSSPSLGKLFFSPENLSGGIWTSPASVTTNDGVSSFHIAIQRRANGETQVYFQGTRVADWGDVAGFTGGGSPGSGSVTLSNYPYNDDWEINFKAVRVSSRLVYSGATYSVPTPAELVPDFDVSTPDVVDMNPAHIIRECLTNVDWGMALPEVMVDDTAFTEAADTLYSEGFGLSMIWSGQSEIETFVNEVLGHIDATYGIDPQTNKFYLRLIRGGYLVESLPVITDDHCRVLQFNRKGLGETTNEVVVTWTNPENEAEETVTVHDLANYSAQGVLISSSRNYYGIRSSALAIRAALRELGKASQPIAVFEIETDRIAWKWKSGDVVKVTYGEYGLSELPCRITSINYGKPGQMAIRVSLIEDVFDMPSTAYVESEGSYWEPPTQPELSITDVIVTTAPYFAIARTVGDNLAEAMTYPEAFNLVMANGYGAMADIYGPVTDAVGNTTFDLTGSCSTVGRVDLSGGMIPEVTSTVSFTSVSDDVQPAPGVVCFIGDDPVLAEVAIIESVTGSSMVIRRGMLDTVPKAWLSGTKCRLVDWSDFPTDKQTNVVGSSVGYRVSPPYTNGEGYVSASVTYSDRQYRPYRPANVTINGSHWPAHDTGNLAVAWSHRNRFMETSVPPIWSASSLTEEAGTTYSIEVLNGATVLHSASGISGSTASVPGSALVSGNLTLRLWAVRDGYLSWQKFEHTFAWTPERITESGETRITESGEVRATE